MMETAKLTKQMIDFQKAAFDNTYAGLTVFQDYTENMTNGFLKQFPWVTEEGKKPIQNSFELMKKSREDYKKMIDQGFDKLAEMTTSN